MVWPRSAATRTVTLLLLSVREFAAQSHTERPAVRSAPAAVTAQRSAQFSFGTAVSAEAGAVAFECQLDAQPWAPCASPATYTSLEDGPHAFHVRAVGADAAGARWQSPASELHTWTVDALPPAAAIHSGPTPVSASTSATFTFAAPYADGTKLCQLDDGGYSQCHSPMTYTGLTEGSHSFTVRVTDDAGNSNDTTAWAWHVDLPPTCEVTAEQPASGSRALVTKPFDVRFSWSEPVNGFAAGAVALGGVGGTLSHWRTLVPGSVFTATVTPAANGRVTVSVPAAAARDDRGKANTASSNVLTATYDGTRPMVTITGPASKQSAPFEVLFLWSEPVMGFSPKSVVLQGAASFSASFDDSTRGSSFTGTVTPMGTGTLTIAVSAGAAADYAGNPSIEAATYDVGLANSNVFVGDHGKVVVFGKDRKLIHSLDGLTAATSSLEVDAAGRLYMGEGEQVTVWAGWTRSSAAAAPLETLRGFLRVSGLDVHHSADGAAMLFVADASAHAVKSFVRRADGDAWQLAWTVGGGGAGSGEYRLNNPLGVEYDAAARRLYVADSGNGRVQAYSAEGTFLATLQHKADLSASGKAESAPMAVDVDGDGRVLVADSGVGGVAVYDRAGLLQRVVPVGREGDTVRGLEVDRSGILYAVLADRVELFDSSFQSLGTLAGLKAPVAVGLYRDEVAPNCTLLAPHEEQHGSFNVTAIWSEQVGGFTAAAVALGGVGGSVTAVTKISVTEYVISVTPAGVGQVTIQIPVDSVRDVEGNANAASAVSAVTYFAGSCSTQLGCQWQLAMYQHQLSLERLSVEATAETDRALELARMAEAASQRREELRLDSERASIALQLEAAANQAALDRETVRERVEAEAAGRIREARENEELNLRRMAAEAEASRRQTLDAVNTVFAHLSSGLQELLTDMVKLRTLVAMVAALAMGVYGAREAARAAARLLKRHLGQPALVRASTMSTFPLGLLTAALRKRTAPAVAFTDVVLEDRLMQRMTAIATATANATKRRAPFRNLLLYGTPGTGKTMVAERLAKAVGLDYAVMSGGDVVPLGKNAVFELHALFDWARASPHGVLLLIDEADAFLRHRDSAGMSEYMRSALNAVLARTGTQSYKIMLVLVTNRPDDLDEAVMDRMDDVVEFALPEAAQRTEMLQLYLRSYLPQVAQLRRGQSAALAVEHKGLTSEVWGHLVKATHGFSGREMAKLMAAVQAVVYGRDGKLVMTAEDLVTMALQKQREHDNKANGFGPSVCSRTNPAFESR